MSLQVWLSIVGVLSSTVGLACGTILSLRGHRLRGLAFVAWNLAILALLFWWLLFGVTP